MAPIPMTLIDREGYFCCLKRYLASCGNITLLTKMCLYSNWKTYTACTCKCRIESERLLEFIGKSGNISETVQDKDILTADH